MTRSALRRFLRARDGSMTLEFAVLAPLFIGLFLSSFELGMLLTRQMMLDRSLDLAVRQVRLGAVTGTPEAMHRALKAMICDRAFIIPDCEDRLTLAMERVQPTAWDGTLEDLPCRDVTVDAEPFDRFRPDQVAASNDMAIMRACAVFEPIMPTNGLGFELVDGTNGTYALRASSAYVVEPN